jgi:hypothetical protein
METKAIDAVELIKQNIVSLVTKSLVEKIVKRATFMAWGPLSSIASYFITKLIRKAVERTVLELYILRVHYQVNKQVKKVDEILKDIHSEMDKDKENEVDSKLNDAFDELFSI